MDQNNFRNHFSIEKRTRYFIPVLSALGIFSVIVFVLLLIGNDVLAKRVAIKEGPVKYNLFDHVSIQAKSAIVLDVVNNRVLYSKDPDQSLPLASLTKIMTALTLSEILPDSVKVKISSDNLNPEGDSGLLVGDSWNISELRDFTLLTSSNDGASALAAVVTPEQSQQISEAQFVNEMNDIGNKIGLSNSKFFNEHGLDRKGNGGENLAGAYGSARDMATLVEYILKHKPNLLEATRYKSLNFVSDEKHYNASNTNTFVDQIPNLIASKTGYTDLAGGNLVIAYDAGLNRPIIIAVLGSSQEGRFDDTLKLVEASLKYVQEI